MTQNSIQELVRKDLLHREQVGIARYGTPLHAYNGRSAILDAYEEAMDLCCYLRQVIEEMTVGDGRQDPGPGRPVRSGEVIATMADDQVLNRFLVLEDGMLTLLVEGSGDIYAETEPEDTGNA